MKTISLACDNCQKSFDRALNFYNRAIKNGKTRFFCSLSCVAQTNVKERPPKGNVVNLRAYQYRPTLDEFSSFRNFLSTAIHRSKRKKSQKRFSVCDLDLQYLQDLWKLQNGICPFTKWEMILPLGTGKGRVKNPANASLDRIDNSKGYIKGNVRFIAIMANMARQSFSDEQLIEFCKAVAKVKCV